MGGKKWSEAETMTMRAHFPTLGYNIAALMQRRTHEAVRAKAKELGIKTPEQAKREAMNVRLREETGFLLNATFSANTIADPDIKEILGIPIDPTKALAEGIPTKECVPCGTLLAWVREWSPNIWPIVLGILIADLILLIEFATKAFGG